MSVSLLAAARPLAAQPADDGVKPDKSSVSESTAENDPLERVIRRMRDAHRKIEARETGDATQQVQKQILRDLDELIRMAQQRKQSQKPQPKSSSKQKQKQSSSDKKSAKKKTAAADQKKPAPKQSDNAKESTEAARRAAAAKQREAELAERRRLYVLERWGHLPESERRRMLNISSDKPLQKYSALVRQYFQALAESAQDPSTRKP